MKLYLDKELCNIYYQNNTVHGTKTDPFVTHQKFLEFYISKTTGDILEFGSGYGSTKFIRDLIKNTDRKLVTYENDKEWINSMIEKIPPNDNHQYVYVKDWDETIKSIPKFNWSIVFIDQSPWDARVTAMKHFKNHVEYIIIHDVDYFSTNNIFGKTLNDRTLNFDDVSDNWKVYYPKHPWACETGPPTLVFSNTGKEIYNVLQ
jgi:hypothetical protein